MAAADYKKTLEVGVQFKGDKDALFEVLRSPEAIKIGIEVNDVNFANNIQQEIEKKLKVNLFPKLDKKDIEDYSDAVKKVVNDSIKYLDNARTSLEKSMGDSEKSLKSGLNAIAETYDNASKKISGAAEGLVAAATNLSDLKGFGDSLSKSLEGVNVDVKANAKELDISAIKEQLSDDLKIKITPEIDLEILDIFKTQLETLKFIVVPEIDTSTVATVLSSSITDIINESLKSKFEVDIVPRINDESWAEEIRSKIYSVDIGINFDEDEVNRFKDKLDDAAHSFSESLRDGLTNIDFSTIFNKDNNTLPKIPLVVDELILVSSINSVLSTEGYTIPCGISLSKTKLEKVKEEIRSLNAIVDVSLYLDTNTIRYVKETISERLMPDITLSIDGKSVINEIKAYESLIEDNWKIPLKIDTSNVEEIISSIKSEFDKYPISLSLKLEEGSISEIKSKLYDIGNERRYINVRFEFLLEDSVFAQGRMQDYFDSNPIKAKLELSAEEVGRAINNAISIWKPIIHIPIDCDTESVSFYIKSLIEYANETKIILPVTFSEIETSSAKKKIDDLARDGVEVQLNPKFNQKKLATELYNAINKETISFNVSPYVINMDEVQRILNHQYYYVYVHPSLEDAEIGDLGRKISLSLASVLHTALQKIITEDVSKNKFDITLNPSFNENIKASLKFDFDWTPIIERFESGKEAFENQYGHVTINVDFNKDWKQDLEHKLDAFNKEISSTPQVVIKLDADSSRLQKVTEDFVKQVSDYKFDMVKLQASFEPDEVALENTIKEISKKISKGLSVKIKPIPDAADIYAFFNKDENAVLINVKHNLASVKKMRSAIERDMSSLEPIRLTVDANYNRLKECVENLNKYFREESGVKPFIIPAVISEDSFTEALDRASKKAKLKDYKFNLKYNLTLDTSNIEKELKQFHNYVSTNLAYVNVKPHIDMNQFKGEVLNALSETVKLNVDAKNIIPKNTKAELSAIIKPIIPTDLSLKIPVSIDKQAFIKSYNELISEINTPRILSERDPMVMFQLDKKTKSVNEDLKQIDSQIANLNRDPFIVKKIAELPKEDISEQLPQGMSLKIRTEIDWESLEESFNNGIEMFKKMHLNVNITPDIAKKLKYPISVDPVLTQEAWNSKFSEPFSVNIRPVLTQDSWMNGIYETYSMNVTPTFDPDTISESINALNPKISLAVEEDSLKGIWETVKLYFEDNVIPIKLQLDANTITEAVAGGNAEDNTKKIRKNTLPIDEFSEMYGTPWDDDGGEEGGEKKEKESPLDKAVKIISYMSANYPEFKNDIDEMITLYGKAANKSNMMAPKPLINADIGMITGKAIGILSKADPKKGFMNTPGQTEAFMKLLSDTFAGINFEGLEGIIANRNVTKNPEMAKVLDKVIVNSINKAVSDIQRINSNYVTMDTLKELVPNYADTDNLAKIYELAQKSYSARDNIVKRELQTAAIGMLRKELKKINPALAEQRKESEIVEKFKSTMNELRKKTSVMSEEQFAKFTRMNNIPANSKIDKSIYLSEASKLYKDIKRNELNLDAKGIKDNRSIAKIMEEVNKSKNNVSNMFVTHPELHRDTFNLRDLESSATSVSDYKNLRTEWQKLESEVRKVYESFEDLNKVLDNLSKLDTSNLSEGSIKDMSHYVENINKGLSGGISNFNVGISLKQGKQLFEKLYKESQSSIKEKVVDITDEERKLAIVEEILGSEHKIYKEMYDLLYTGPAAISKAGNKTIAGIPTEQMKRFSKLYNESSAGPEPKVKKELRVMALKGLDIMTKKGIGILHSGAMRMIGTVEGTFMRVIKRTVSMAIKPFTVSIKSFIKSIKGASSKSKVLSSLSELFLMPIVIALEYTLIPVLKKMIPAIREVIQWVINSRQKFELLGKGIANVVHAVYKVMVGNFITALEKFFQKLNDGKDVITKLYSDSKTFFEDLKEKGVSIKDVSDNISTLAEVSANAAKELSNLAQNKDGQVNFISDFVLSIIEAVTKNSNAIADAIYQFLSNDYTISKMKEGMTLLIDSFLEVLSKTTTLAERIISIFTGQLAKALTNPENKNFLAEITDNITKIVLGVQEIFFKVFTTPEVMAGTAKVIAAMWPIFAAKLATEVASTGLGTIVSSKIKDTIDRKKIGKNGGSGGVSTKGTTGGIADGLGTKVAVGSTIGNAASTISKGTTGGIADGLGTKVAVGSTVGNAVESTVTKEVTEEIAEKTAQKVIAKGVVSAGAKAAGGIALSAVSGAVGGPVGLGISSVTTAVESIVNGLDNNKLIDEMKEQNATIGEIADALYTSGNIPGMMTAGLTNLTIQDMEHYTGLSEDYFRSLTTVQFNEFSKLLKEKTNGFYFGASQEEIQEIVKKVSELSDYTIINDSRLQEFIEKYQIGNQDKSNENILQNSDLLDPSQTPTISNLTNMIEANQTPVNLTLTNNITIDRNNNVTSNPIIDVFGGIMNLLSNVNKVS